MILTGHCQRRDLRDNVECYRGLKGDGGRGRVIALMVMGVLGCGSDRELERAGYRY